MAWSDWSEFDTAGLIGGALGEKLEPAARYFSDIEKELRSESAKSLSRVEQMKGILLDGIRMPGESEELDMRRPLERSSIDNAESSSGMELPREGVRTAAPGPLD